MPEYIRVRQNATGHEFTVRADSDLTGRTVIDRPAVDRNGRIIPPKYKTTVAAAAKSTRKPAEKPAEKPTEKPAGKTGGKPAGKRARRSTRKPGPQAGDSAEAPAPADDGHEAEDEKES